MQMRALRFVALVALSGGVIAACGGGGDTSVFNNNQNGADGSFVDPGTFGDSGNPNNGGGSCKPLTCQDQSIECGKAGSVMLWGSESTVRERLAAFGEVNFERRIAAMRYPFPPAGTVDFFRRYYGPTGKAFDALAPDAQAALRQLTVSTPSRSAVGSASRAITSPTASAQTL